MNPRQKRLALIGCWVAAAIPAIGQLWLLLYTSLARFGYPYDLEWMEGGLLTHAQRISDGSGIYVEPSVDFIPYLYTPLYPGLVGMLGGSSGISYQLGRGISILSILLVLAFMTIAILRDSEKEHRPAAWFGAAAAAGFFSATYPWLEGWYDLVRADTLFLAMILGGLLAIRVWARAGSGAAGHIRIGAAAAVLGLSFFCKQTGILYVACGGFMLLALNFWRIPVYVAVAGVIGLGGTALLNSVTGGWFWTYIYKVHQAHDFHMPRFWESFWHMFGQFKVMTAIIGITAIVVLTATAAQRKVPRSSSGFLIWGFVYAVSCVVGAVGWGTQWAHFNAYMPAMMTGALACGAAVPALIGTIESWPKRPDWLPTAAGLTAAGAIAVQLVFAWWNPEAFIPTDDDRRAGDTLVAELKQVEGDIYVPYHPWYARLAGKRTYVHRMGVSDVTYGGKWKVAGLSEAIREQRFGAVVLDNRPPRGAAPGLSRYYVKDVYPIGAQPRVYTGAGRRYGKHAKLLPNAIWVAKRRVRVLFDFERNGFSGWHVEGTAWGKAPARKQLPGQGRVRGFGGRLFANSMHGGDKATGTLTSPPFRIQGKRISARISGGSHKTLLQVELLVGDEVVRRATGSAPDENMRKVMWETKELIGKEARIRLVDQHTGSWGHMNVDEIWEWR